MKIYIIKSNFNLDKNWHYVVAANSSTNALLLAMYDDDRIDDYHSEITNTYLNVDTDKEQVISGEFWWGE